MTHSRQRDPLGRALELEWQRIKYGRSCATYEILVQSDAIEDETMRAEYFFRDFNQMPMLEQQALDLCRGRVLDVGAAAGCHALVLQGRGLDVLALDTSYGAVSVMQDRGLQAQRRDFYTLDESIRFDTILVLMNGLGLAESLPRLPYFFKKLKSLLAKNGQVLVDSSDFGVDAKIFTEIYYQMRFQNLKSKIFSWLFLPFHELAKHAHDAGLQADLLSNGESGAYLARLQVTSP